MRFAFFSLRHDPNGGCRLQVELMNGLVERGHEVVFGLPFYLAERPFWTPCLAEKVDAMRVPRMGRFDGVFFSHVDSYNPGYPLSGLAGCCDAGHRFFVLRSFLPGHIAVTRDRSVEKLATSRWLFETASFFGGPVHKVFGGVNAERFASDGCARARNAVPVVLFKDSMDSVKGSAMVPEALEVLRGRGVGFEVLRLGGLEHEVREEFARADVFVCGEAAWGLGWSCAVAEAMSAGCAVVCTDTPAVEHVAEDGVTALLVRPGDAAGMADALERAVLDAGLRARLAEAGLERVRLYPVRGMVDRIVELARV